MAQPLKDYAKVRGWIDEQFMVEITSISKRTNAGNIPMNLMNEGLGGFSDGSGETSVAIGYVIPRSGPEFNFDKATVDKGYHNVQITVGNLSCIIKGKFSDNEVGQSTDQGTAGTVNFMGGLTALE